VLTVFASALLVTGCESFVVTTSTSATASRSTRSHNNRQQLFATTTTTDKHERTRWYTCCSTKEMVKAVDIFVRETDVVAELGAHLRDVSTAISTNSHSAVMVDVERKFPSGGSKDQRTSAMRRDAKSHRWRTGARPCFLITTRLLFVPTMFWSSMFLLLSAMTWNEPLFP
jgi:hypothetical protein